jgi:hypothetical protein
VIKGLFVEASKHSSLMLSLEQSLTNKTTYRWGVPYIAEYLFLNNTKTVEIIESLGVTKIVSDHLLFIDKTFTLNDDYYIYELDGELAYVPDDLAFIASENFFFLRNNFIQNPKNAYVKIQNPMPQEFTFEAEINYDFNDKLIVEMQTNKLTPVLINIEYSHKWRAKNSKGQIPIFEAYPNRMLVFSDETFELSYKAFSRNELIGMIITILTILLLILIRSNLHLRKLS